MLRIPKILKKIYYVRLALSNKTHLSIVVVALQKHFAYDLSLKIMILAQNWPKTAKSSWHSSFKSVQVYLLSTHAHDDVW